jgi:ABC-type Fe3+/spermidine/putrescine transport system ATPase subunit
MMLRLENINRRFGQFALSDINLNISEGEYYVLLGRSGSGKTLLLELIAGLTFPDSGTIWLDNEDITSRKIQKRNTGLVFQDYAIFPNMTVFGNIAYPLMARKTDKKEIFSAVKNIAAGMNIDHILNRNTHNLSGGELQRVALARTLITSPRLLLLDEPMASVDASLRDDIKRILRKLNKDGHTIIHVTHDYREAVNLASRAGVIHNGRIIQEGLPAEVFRKPVNRFVARYAGIRNFFRVRFRKEAGRWKAICPNKLVFNIQGDDHPGEGLVIVRSDDVKVFREKPAGEHDNCFMGTITDIIPCVYGMEILVDAGEKFFVDVRQEEFEQLGARELSDVWIAFPARAVIVLNESN